MAKKRDIVVLDNGFTRNQSNVSKFVTEAKSKMTATELKAFYLLTTLIRADDTDFKDYEIGINDFCKALNIDLSNKSQVKNLCKSLLKQDFILDFTHENTDWDLIKISIFKQFSYRSKEQKILITFSDDIKPHLLELKKKFTKIEQVKYIQAFDGKYAIRIYALLKDYRLLSYRDIEIEALVKMLNLPKSYRDFSYINKKVLEPAINEINAKSDLEIYEIEQIKKIGKKIARIRIHFGNKGDKQAKDIMAMLAREYKRTKDYACFVGYKYAFNIPPSNPGDCITITHIDTQKHEKVGLYFSAYHKQDLIFAGPKINFEKTLFNGIYAAALYTIENEKSLKLDVNEWQDKQDKIKQVKELLKSWAEKNKHNI